jgi:hypothetical protein
MSADVSLYLSCSLIALVYHPYNKAGNTKVLYIFSLAHKTNLVHNFFLCMFISIRNMFWATMCPSSGENNCIYAIPGICHFAWLKNTRCRNDTVISPDDGHIVA